MQRRKKATKKTTGRGPTEEKIYRFFKKNLLIKNYSISERIKYYNYVRAHLKKIGLIKSNACLEKTATGFTIDNKINLTKQIGSKSVYGVIYETSVQKMLRKYPIATKLMKLNADNIKEARLNDAISSNIVKHKLSRHFVLCYKYYKCMEYYKYDNRVPHAIQDSQYIIALNEHVSGDLLSLFKHNDIIFEDDAIILNLILQCLLSIATFHKLGWIHQDCHPGNFLFLLTDDTAGHYHYKILGKDYYLKNCGYTLMIYDFGLAEKNNGFRPKYYSHYDTRFKQQEVEFKYDFYDYKNIMSYLDIGQYNHKLSWNIRTFVRQIINMTVPNQFNTEDELITAICQHFTDKCPITGMFTNVLPDDKLVNIKPYIIDDSLIDLLPSALASPVPSPQSAKELESGLRTVQSFWSLSPNSPQAKVHSSSDPPFALMSARSRTPSIHNTSSSGKSGKSRKSIGKERTMSLMASPEPKRAKTNKQIAASLRSLPSLPSLSALSSRPSSMSLASLSKMMSKLTLSKTGPNKK